MTVSNTIVCPHCQATNEAGGAFCESCGKALPSAAPAGPRVVSADALPESAVGQRLVSDELVKTQKRASTALLAVAIIATVGVGIIYAISAGAAHLPAETARALRILVAVQAGVCILFWGLWIWSRKAPLPAAIVGLVIYATLVTINVVNAMSQMASNPNGPKRGFGGFGVGLLDIIIIILLISGIKAGLKHKRLQQQVQMA